MIEIYHVEYNDGTITGRFLSSGLLAVAFAEMKAVQTKRPTKIIPVTVPSFDPARICLMLNDDPQALVWHEDQARVINPEDIP